MSDQDRHDADMLARAIERQAKVIEQQRETIAKLRAENEALHTAAAQLRGDVLDLRDSIAPSTDSVADAATKARATRAELDRVRALLTRAADKRDAFETDNERLRDGLQWIAGMSRDHAEAQAASDAKDLLDGKDVPPLTRRT